MEPKEAEPLLRALQSDDETMRERATAELWQLWYTQKGAYGAHLLVQSQRLLDSGKTKAAQDLLDDLIRDQPDFAEAWNRRAVLNYMDHRYKQAIADCEQTIALVPYHFGALHGLGLCHAALGNYLAAIQAWRRALAVQPHALTNQRLILEYTAKLS